MDVEVVGSSGPESFEDEPLRYRGYAGFWPRLAANLVDALVLLPLVAFVYGSRSQSVYLRAGLPLTLISAAYPIVMHALYGQTLGKMVARVRVVTVDAEPIGWKHAVARSAIEVALALVSQFAVLSAVQHMPAAAWNQDFAALSKAIRAMEPGWGHLASTLAALWSMSELAVLLTNHKRRALHDFIAGTVVVNLPRRDERDEDDDEQFSLVE